MNGTLDANGTLVLCVIMLSFALWNRKTFKQERQQIERRRNIEKNENRLRKKYNIYKLRKVNKH